MKQINEAPASRAGLAKTVLLVDDESALLHVLGQALREQGYLVLEASGSREALEIASQMHRPPAVMITDIMLDSVDGPELAKTMKKKYGLRRVIFMSGAADSFEPGESPYIPAECCFQKPFRLSEMLSCLSGLLAQDDEPGPEPCLLAS